MTFIIIKDEIDEECGCIEQEIECDCGFLSLHFKPDGIAELYFDNGDDDWEIEIEADSISELHCKIKRYVESLPILG